MSTNGQAVTIKIAGDRPRTTGTGQNVKVIHGITAEQYLAFLDAPLRAELAHRLRIIPLAQPSTFAVQNTSGKYTYIVTPTSLTPTP